MTYNVENLFDGTHHMAPDGKPLDDWPYTPLNFAGKNEGCTDSIMARGNPHWSEGLRHKLYTDCIRSDYNEAKFQLKLDHISQVITNKGEEPLPDIIALTEITSHKSVEALAKCGAMDDLAERNMIIGNLETLLSFNKESKNIANQDSLFGLFGGVKVNLSLIPQEKTNMKEKLSWEKELLGLFISGHPLDAFREKLEALRNVLKSKEDQYAWLAEKHTALQAGIFEARIINHDRWHNHNEIIFKLIDPLIDVFYIPSDNSEERVLGLHQDEDGAFSIKVMSQ